MDPEAAGPPIAEHVAVRRVRTLAWCALLPPVLVVLWWAAFWWTRGDVPAGGTASWTTELTTWVRHRWRVPIPFVLAAAGTLFGPTLVAIAGILVLKRSRQAPERVPMLLAFLAGAAVLCFLTATWISIEWRWEIEWPDGNREGYMANHSMGPCCGLWNLALAGWAGWATLRLGPTFRAGFGPSP